jgi:peptidoglycan/LPS O-acetylase OafA/YrhL
MLNGLRNVVDAASGQMILGRPQSPNEINATIVLERLKKVERSQKLDSLTSMRFVAAGMIVIHHSRGQFGIPVDIAGRFLLDQAVSFFFVLSGFILTYVYPRLDTWEARGRFWLARFGRVWPAHFAAFGVLWMVLQRPNNFPTGVSTWWLGILNLTLVHAWVPVWNVFFSFNAVSWSISAEMLFYIVFPLFIIDWSKSWWWKLGLALLPAVGLIWACARFNIPIPGEGKEWSITTTGLVYIHPLARLFEFTLGMSTALVYRGTVGRIREFAGRTALKNRRTMLMTVLELAAIGLVLLNMYEVQRLVLSLAWAGPAAIEWAVHGPVCCFAFAVLIFMLATETGAVSRILAARPAVLLGEISFSVYLLHQIIITWYQQNERQFEVYPGWLMYGLFWAVLLVGAWLVWAGVERPMRGWIVGLWKRPNHVASTLPKSESLHGLWSALMAPSRYELGGGILTLALLLFPVKMTSGHAVVKRNDQLAVQMVADKSPQAARSVRFGNVFELVGVEMEQANDTGMEIKLGWRSLLETELKYRVAVHFTDDSGKIIGQADYDQDVEHTRVSAGAAWVDRVVLPKEKMTGVTWVGFVVYEIEKGTQLVSAAPGRRVDSDGTRLLLPLVPSQTPVQ